MARDDWIICVGGWQAAQLIFVDESAANERTMDRKFGWGLKGQKARETRPAKRSECWSLLPAYTLDGYITYDLIQGSYTTELFNTFIETKVLRLCNPSPGPRSILVMDNAKIHKSEVNNTIIHGLNYKLISIETQMDVQRRWCTTGFPSTILQGQHSSWSLRASAYQI